MKETSWVVQGYQIAIQGGGGRHLEIS